MSDQQNSTPQVSPFSGVEEAMHIVAKQQGIKHFLIYYSKEDWNQALLNGKPQSWASL